MWDRDPRRQPFSNDALVYWLTLPAFYWTKGDRNPYASPNISIPPWDSVGPLAF